MPESEKVNAPPRDPVRKRWRRRVLGAFLAAAVLAVLFHRPILLWALRTAAIQIARHENVALSLEVEGSVLTGLTLRHVHGVAVPGGEERSPLRSVEIGYARFDYSLLRLLRGGVTEFLSSYALHDASLVVEAPPPEGKRRHKRFARLLRDVLQQPALFSNRVEVENFNLLARFPEGVFSLKELDVRLAPDEPGFIAIREVSVPLLTTWRDLRAEATYAQRHLVVGAFHLGDAIRVERLELDGSRRAEGRSALFAKGHLFGGDAEFHLQERGGGKTKIAGNVAGLSLDALDAFFHGRAGVSGTLDRFALELEGEPDAPSSWRGEAGMEMGNGALGHGRLAFDAARIHLLFRDGALQVGDTFLAAGENRVRFEGTHALPDSYRTLRREGIDLGFDLQAPRLETLTLRTGGVGSARIAAKGALSGRGTLHLAARELAATFDLATPGLEWQRAVPGSPPLQIATGRGQIHASLGLNLRRRMRAAPWHEKFSLRGDASFSPREAAGDSGSPGPGSGPGLQVGGVAFDTASATMRLQDGEAAFEAVELRRGENNARLSGRLRLPAPGEALRWEEADFDLRFAIDAPALAELNAEGSGSGKETRIHGALTATGEFQHGNGATHGGARIDARDLAFGEFSARRLTAELPVEGETARITGFLLDLNGTDRLSGEGSLRLRAPFAYEGKLAGSVSDLSVFQPLAHLPLAGSLQVDWHGAGAIRSWRHSGGGRLAVQKGTVGSVTGLEGEVAGEWSPESIEIPTFHFRCDQGAARAVLSLAGQRLRVRELEAEFGKENRRSLITGHFSLPLDLRNADEPETILPDSGALEGELKLRQIDLARFFPDPPPSPSPAKSPAPARHAAPPAPAPAQGPGLSGLADATLTAGGTVAAPELTLTVKGRELRSRRVAKLEAASLDASLRLRGSRLALEGTAAVPGLSPLRFAGEIPLELRAALRGERLDSATPLKLSVRLPSSSAALFGQVLPGLRRMEGRLSLDASATGTLGQPVFGGGVRVALPAIRFQNPSLPGINNLEADLRFSGNRLAIHRFSGDVAGGPFHASGSVLLEKWTEPQLDLRLRSKGTLLVRNDSLIVRTDSDLKIAGPLGAAKVSGKVGINRSRFFRDVEILPIGLPGRPAPKAAGMPKRVSIEAAPVRNWSFDVAIQTTEPMRIRNNLAQGQVVADLRLGGTGLAPTLEGTAQIRNFVASLPFSQLQVDHGFVRFTPGDSFNPTLDIHGSSRLRDYEIAVHIYGTASDPETLFSSEPPLAQEEIVALLATGATTREFTENNQVLAGRAGVLLLQDLYRKLFKGKAPPPSATERRGDDKPLMERFHLDVGTVDPRTGRQQMGGRFELSRQFEVGAGIDLEGDVKLQLRYLLRFR